MKLIRFILQYGHHIDVVDSFTNATSYFDLWKSGAYALRGDKYLSGVDQLGRQWALLTDQLIGVVVQDPPVEVQQAIQQQGVRFPMSGRN